MGIRQLPTINPVNRRTVHIRTSIHISVQRCTKNTTCTYGRTKCSSQKIIRKRSNIKKRKEKLLQTSNEIVKNLLIDERIRKIEYDFLARYFYVIKIDIK